MNKSNQFAAERLYLNADKTKAVPEGDKAAAFLWASKGDEIPAEACERFGIVDGKLKAAKGGARSSGSKGGKAPANKGGKAPANKDASGAAENKDAGGAAENKDAGGAAENKDAGE